MQVLLVSPGFPPQYGLFVHALADRGIRVLGLGDVHPDLLDRSLIERFHAYAYCPSLEDRAAVVEQAKRLAARTGPIHRVESFNEHWLGLDAMLREALSVPGPTPEIDRQRRDKASMHEVFEQHGIVMPKGRNVARRSDVEELYREVGGPIIVKPRRGVGASGVFEIKSAQDIASLDEAAFEDAVAQEKIEGTVTTYDGLVDDAGGVTFAVSFIYARGVLEFVRDQPDVWYYTRRAIPSELEQLGQRILRAFDVRCSFFHIEAFERPDGSFVALEINFRPPGGFSTDLMNYACDVDVYRLYARVVSEPGRRVSFDYAMKYHAAHVGRRNRPYALDEDAATAALGSALMVRGELPPVIAHAMGSPVFLIRHESSSALLELIEQITRTA